MENKPDLSQFAAAGDAAGRAYAVFYQSFLEGFADQYGCPPPVHTPPEAPAEDTEGGTCIRCWCNECANINDCDAFPPSDDGIRPAPCAACNQSASPFPLMPKSAPAECGTFTAIPERCKACWCAECGAFENCVVEKDGFDPSVKPCPCDGCAPGAKAWMPKENPPCEHFTKRE